MTKKRPIATVTHDLTKKRFVTAARCSRSLTATHCEFTASKCPQEETHGDRVEQLMEKTGTWGGYKGWELSLR